MSVHALMFYHDGSVNILVCVLQVLLHTICQRITTFVPSNGIQPEYELGPKIVYSERVNTATTTLYDTKVSDVRNWNCFVSRSNRHPHGLMTLSGINLLPTPRSLQIS